jgi:hypothetical protein
LAKCGNTTSCLILRVLKAPFVLALAVAVATLVPVSIAFTPYGPEIGEQQDVGVYNNADSRIEDPRGDAEAIYQQFQPDSAPPVRDYHDIVGASVAKRGEAFFLAINLAGNPNSNENYETIYRWHIVTTSPITGRDQQYTIIFPHFSSSGASNSTNEGWYFAVYDETVDTFIRSPVKIQDMPEDRVEFPLEDFYIGAPTDFVYWVDVSVRLNATFGEPDYLMDYAP